MSKWFWPNQTTSLMHTKILPQFTHAFTTFNFRLILFYFISFLSNLFSPNNANISFLYTSEIIKFHRRSRLDQGYEGGVKILYKEIYQWKKKGQDPHAITKTTALKKVQTKKYSRPEWPEGPSEFFGAFKLAVNIIYNYTCLIFILTYSLYALTCIMT